jgi:uncharacterized RDD family membrane protein YckC
MTTDAVTRDTVCAGFFERAVAVIIDALILLIPNLILSLVRPGALGIILSVALGLAYAVYFWTSSGATLGKAAMSLKVVSADGGALLTPGTAVFRYFAEWISAIPLGLGFLWVIWDPKHEAWHDKIVATKVIKVK